jgi:hypothetical protein
MKRERTNRRNSHGVKASCDCYRTIKGHEYQAWTSCASDDRIAAYRKAGVRCRRFGDELFVHVFDTEEAARVDMTCDA